LMALIILQQTLLASTLVILSETTLISHPQTK
jgi:hypothetical protein